MRRRLQHPDADAGSVTVFFAVSMLGLLLLIGLVADGGAKLRATQRADAVAAEAARAGGQALDLSQAVTGTDTQVDPAAAIRAAQDYLNATHVTGTVTVSADRAHLLVTVNQSAPTTFLGLIGIDSLPVTGHAQAQLVDGITGGTP
jgi:hypothetical protein